MMGIYIKGMEMPKAIEPELVIEFADGIDGKRYARLHHYQHGALTEWFETVPVPPHGRLIDADALMREFEKAQRTMSQHGQEYSCSFMSSSQEISTEWYCVEDMLENAPTIIEAEEGDE